MPIQTNAAREKKRQRVRRDLRRSLGRNAVCAELVRAIRYLRLRNQEVALLNIVLRLALAQERRIRQEQIEEARQESERTTAGIESHGGTDEPTQQQQHLEPRQPEQAPPTPQQQRAKKGQHSFLSLPK